MMKKNFWKNKKVLITGHTGFKGRWLSLILDSIGANVYGISLKPNNTKIYYSLISKNYYFDINNFNNCYPSILQDFQRCHGFKIPLHLNVRTRV